MKEILISLAVGIFAALAAYALQGFIRPKSRSNATAKKEFGTKKSEHIPDESAIETQQPVEQTERLIPTREWTGGQR